MKNTPSHTTASSRSGMTLIELLVVIAIIMILMGLVIGISGVAQRNSAEAKAKAEIGQISLELEKYRGDRGALPPQKMLGAPHNRPSLGSDFFVWYQEKYGNTVFDMTDFSGTGPDRILLDPWGGAYRYELVSPFIYVLGSHGPDNTWNNGDDITNRNLN